MSKPQFLSLVATASFLTCLGIVVSPVRAATFISYTSQPGDYIGAGRTQTLTPIDGYITASGNFDNGVSIGFQGDTWWYLNLVPSQGETLVPGTTYEGASRFPFQSPNKPGLDFSGDGRGCNTLTGQFKVLEAAYDPDGSIGRFDADFEQHCEGAAPALFGQVRFNKADSKASTDEIQQATRISETEVEKLLQLSDKIQQFPTALYFMSEPGDYIGEGLTQTFTPVDVDFNVSHSDNGVSFYLNNFARSQPQDDIWWDLNFATPQGMQLVPGNYGHATRYPFNSPTKPGLDVSGDGRGCNQSIDQFIVLDAAYKPDMKVDRFDALFEQHCEGGGPALFGRIRFNEPVESKSVPEPMMTLGLLSISSLMLTQRRRSEQTL